MCMATILFTQEPIRHLWVIIRWDLVVGSLAQAHRLLMLVGSLHTAFLLQAAARRRKDKALHTVTCTIPTSLLKWHTT